MKEKNPTQSKSSSGVEVKQGGANSWSTVFALPSEKIPLPDVSLSLNDYANQIIGRMGVSDFRIMYTTVMCAVYKHYKAKGGSLEQKSGHYIQRFFSGDINKFRSDFYGVETTFHYQMLGTLLRRYSVIVFEFAKSDEEEEEKIHVGRTEIVTLAQLHCASLTAVMGLLKKNFDPVMQKKYDSCSLNARKLYAYEDYQGFIQTFFNYSRPPQKVTKPQESSAPSSSSSSEPQVKREGEGEGVAVVVRADSSLSPGKSS